MKKDEREENLKQKLEEMLSYERALWDGGVKNVAGVDEVGRGPLAGPVCAACVVLPPDFDVTGINDSKKLSEKKRAALFDLIIEKAVAYGIGTAGEREIDEINILNAAFLAMTRAVDALTIRPDFCYVDGNQKIKGLKIPCEAIVKGDGKCPSIAAASILAKVSRDNFMNTLDEQYPQYNFKKHKGYGTAEHIELIKKFGSADIHRTSFLKNIIK